MDPAMLGYEEEGSGEAGAGAVSELCSLQLEMWGVIVMATMGALWACVGDCAGVCDSTGTTFFVLLSVLYTPWGKGLCALYQNPWGLAHVWHILNEGNLNGFLKINLKFF